MTELLRRLREVLRRALPAPLRRLVDRAARWLRGRVAHGHGEHDAGHEPPPEPAPWPLPQLPVEPVGPGVLRVLGPTGSLADGEVAAHPNRLASGRWTGLVIDSSALVAGTVWAGAFGPCGAPLTATLERLADELGRVRVRWDAPPDALDAAGVDRRRLAALEGRRAA